QTAIFNWSSWIANFSLEIPPPPMLTSNQAFIAQVYKDLLHRQADSSGRDSWSGLLDQNVSRAQVVRMIENSTEYRTVVVQDLYRAYLHRPADPQGLSGFVAFLGAGGTIEQVKAAILTSPEYFQTSGGRTNVGF